MKHKNNINLYEKINRGFFENGDVVWIAKNLLGKRLCSMVNDVFTCGMIVETEAYCGRGDKACHANNKKTPRTEVMYMQGGHAYIYLCYGIHYLFNVVTNVEGLADAVLIRALEPLQGIGVMNKRRNFPKKLMSGPGTLTQALGIDISLNGIDLTGDMVWIDDYSNVSANQVLAGQRIGIDSAEEDALLPWRFVIKGNKYVSKDIR